MRKGLLIIIFLIITNAILCCNMIYAKQYDIKDVSQAKCVSEYPDEIDIDQIDTVILGSYPQSDKSGNEKDPIEWFVLGKEGNTAFLLSKYILDYNKMGYYSIKYFTDAIRKDFGMSVLVSSNVFPLYDWLSNDFFNMAFTKNEQNHIVNYEWFSGPRRTIGRKISFPRRWILKKYSVNNNKNITRGTNYSLKRKNDFNLKEYGSNVELSTSLDEVSIYWLDDVYYSSGVGEPVCDFSRSNDSQYYDDHELSLPCKNGAGVRPLICVSLSNNNDNTRIDNATNTSGLIAGLPQVESELRNDGHFYLNNNMQKNQWVYYVVNYYHVDGQGNIEKSKWIEQRYVGVDGKMYVNKKTPDGKYVGEDGLMIADTNKDLQDSILVKQVESDAWYRTKSGLWYYFENDRTTTKKGWYTDKKDGQTYYLDPQTGIMAVGWTTIDGKQYYFNEQHDNSNNWYEVGNGIYDSYGKKVKAYGSMYRNEITPDGLKVDVNGALIQ